MRVRHLFIVLFFSILSNCKVPKVDIANTIDPDILLINIEDGDRDFIRRVLLKIDSLNPVLVCINAIFERAKHPAQDSLLKAALHKIPNDFLVYSLREDKKHRRSIRKFTSEVSGEGFIDFYEYIGLVSEMTPIAKISDELHETIALKIAKQWKPNLKFDFAPNESITINYTRPLEKFIRIYGTDLLHIPIHDFDLPNKIVLVGYIGPKNEDMYRTPLRLTEENELKHNKPDTYGLVILANQIRTVLDYGKE